MNIMKLTRATKFRAGAGCDRGEGLRGAHFTGAGNDPGASRIDGSRDAPTRRNQELVTQLKCTRGEEND